MFKIHIRPTFSACDPLLLSNFDEAHHYSKIMSREKYNVHNMQFIINGKLQL